MSGSEFDRAFLYAFSVNRFDRRNDDSSAVYDRSIVAAGADVGK